MEAVYKISSYELRLSLNWKYPDFFLFNCFQPGDAWRANPSHGNSFISDIYTPHHSFPSDILIIILYSIFYFSFLVFVRPSPPSPHYLSERFRSMALVQNPFLNSTSIYLNCGSF